MKILGDLFGFSAGKVSHICFTWWRFLAREFGSLVYNPPRFAVSKTLPESFKVKPYNKVRHIIDCTEIFIETPKSLDLAAACWASYKHHHTVKYLVSVNPNGFINFVSKGCGGRISDNKITELSGFLEILEPYDMGLADKGFQLIKLFAQHLCSIVTPPGRLGEGQMRDDDVKKRKKLPIGEL